MICYHHLGTDPPTNIVGLPRGNVNIYRHQLSILNISSQTYENNFRQFCQHWQILIATKVARVRFDLLQDI